MRDDVKQKIEAVIPLRRFGTVEEVSHALRFLIEKMGSILRQGVLSDYVRIIGRGFRVLSTQAYNLYTSEIGGNPGLASSVSIVLISVSLVFVYVDPITPSLKSGVSDTSPTTRQSTKPHG